MQILYTVTLLLFTLVFANCQTDTSTDTGASESSLTSISSEFYSTSGDVTSCKTDENVPDTTSSITMTSEQDSLNITTPDTGLTSESLENATTNNAIFEPQTSVTTSTTSTTSTSSTPKKNLSLILGLSLGLGIPALLAVIVGITCYLKKGKSSRNYDI